MKKLLAIVLSVTLLAVGLVGASPVSASPDTVDLIADGPDSSFTLIVGDVTVTDDGTNLTIVYTLDVDDWELVETHLHVAGSLAGIPQNGKANPKVGHFDYSDEWDPTIGTDVRTVTYTVPIPGPTVYIAAQAVVYSATIADPDLIDPVPPREESAWANGTQFNVGKNWAMYFTYTPVD